MPTQTAHTSARTRRGAEANHWIKFISGLRHPGGALDKHAGPARRHHQGLTLGQSHLPELLRRNLRLDDRVLARLLGLLDRDQFQPCDRADHDGAVQPHHDATRRAVGVLPLAGNVALHVEIVRPHIGERLGVLRVGMFWRLQLHAFEVDFALVGAAMEQVDVAQKAVDERAGRMVPDLLRRADLLDAAGVHQHHPVGDFQRFFLVVGDENTGHMQLVMQAPQPAPQFLAHFGIQRAKRLVQQQHLRLHRQGACQGNALALAA